MYFKEWLDLLEGVDDVINSLRDKINPETWAMLQSLGQDEKQWIIGPLKKTPSLVVQQIQQLLDDPRRTKKSDPYVRQEYEVAGLYPENMKKWVMIGLRKLRMSNKDQWEAAVQQMTRDHDVALSFLQHNKVDLANTEMPQFLEHIAEWKEVLSGKGKGKFYGPNKKVVYGPTWENQEFNGWTIQSVDCENDLGKEGEAMAHCVGGFSKSVKDGRAVIYSLRDPANHPHVTMEYRPQEKKVVQIMGFSNDDPKDKYKAMMREWLSKERSIVHVGGMDSDIEPLKKLSAEIDAVFKKFPNQESMTKRVRGLTLSMSSLDDVEDAVRNLADDNYGSLEKMADRIPGYKDLLDKKKEIDDPDFDLRDPTYQYRLQPDQEIKDKLKDDNMFLVRPEQVRRNVFRMYEELLNATYGKARKMNPDDIFQWMDRGISEWIKVSVERDKEYWKLNTDGWKQAGFTDDDFIKAMKDDTGEREEMGYEPHPKSKEPKDGYAMLKRPQSWGDKTPDWRRMIGVVEVMNTLSNVIKIDELITKQLEKQPLDLMRLMPKRKAFASFTAYYNSLGRAMNREGYDLPPFGPKNNIISLEFDWKVREELLKQTKRDDGKSWFMD